MASGRSPLLTILTIETFKDQSTSYIMFPIDFFLRVGPEKDRRANIFTGISVSLKRKETVQKFETLLIKLANTNKY